MQKYPSVLVTGASGFIAKHIVLKLLNAGHSVRGSLRSAARADEVRDAVRPHLQDPRSLDRLSFIELDLTRDDGWSKAMKGIDALIHTASPFPLAQPKDEQDLIRPAVDGALRALRAADAAGVGRVVMTSSSVAVMGASLPVGKIYYDEEDWTDINAPGTSAYAKSKTLAEQAAWAYVEKEASNLGLTTINPVFVLGPPLDGHYGSSVSVVERLLRGKDPMLPNFGMPIVDVRDVAEAHIRALAAPASIGQRVIASGGFMWFPEMARTLKAAYPDRKITTRKAPNLLIRLLAFFDKEIRSVVPILNEMKEVSNDRARSLLGVEFLSPEAALRASAAYLIDNNRV